MELKPSDPDVETVVGRLRRNELDLQPEFQRGEVWSDSKKRRLIDSILRDWHVPPIHVVDVPATGVDEVLDGQQRLRAILQFADNDLTVEGRIEPLDPKIQSLHGKKYRDLPPPVRRRFDKFALRLFRLTNYQPEEPGELFFRLNMPATLTPAEQRNAFYGPARQQIKALVRRLHECGLSEQVIGFSNTRMAYDDVLAGFCLALESGSLTTKVTASRVTSKFRSHSGFADSVQKKAEASMDQLGTASQFWPRTVRFNKPTLQTWLCFSAEILPPQQIGISAEELGRFIEYFETRRAAVREKPDETPQSAVLTLFNARASSRVSDVSSVVIRDLAIWLFLEEFAGENEIQLNSLHPRLVELESARVAAATSDISVLANQVLESGRWGSSL